MLGRTQGWIHQWHAQVCANSRVVIAADADEESAKSNFVCKGLIGAKWFSFICPFLSLVRSFRVSHIGKDAKIATATASCHRSQMSVSAPPIRRECEQLVELSILVFYLRLMSDLNTTHIHSLLFFPFTFYVSFFVANVRGLRSHWQTGPWSMCLCCFYRRRHRRSWRRFRLQIIASLQSAMAGETLVR